MKLEDKLNKYYKILSKQESLSVSDQILLVSLLKVLYSYVNDVHAANLFKGLKLRKDLQKSLRKTAVGKIMAFRELAERHEIEV